MRLFKDSEKEELKKLVKSCLLEISKLRLELNKCRNKLKKLKNEGYEAEIRNKNLEIINLKNIIQEKDKKIKVLKEELSKKDKKLKKLEKYIEALTSKPKPGLTSFQSQIYHLLPSKKASAKELHDFVKKVGFKELKFESMLNILKALEREGYARRYETNNGTLWEKINK
ncbi:conserved hypothetical protein [Methanothermus fervidus DSM 2088]|uniref:Uncharacterized protein n=1 Tax=Methanothermus fervidus (strain ATCC 43054 / DSM 2088 / JCM 10308 / V24 S) TaxID=523846 RepID=E3GYU0_METFV|nr:hypothetical protein [Methanothermus fervidus]ADP77472.1 conserved hypothetical protein [Methanothermus fervidus DSM 2088]